MAVAGGITFGDSKATLAKVTDNGVCDDDPRVLTRANEATKALLDEGTWVHGMATYNIAGIESPANTGVAGTQIWLPATLENAIEAEVVIGSVRGATDVKQGWFDLVNNFVFVDPNFAHDNPMVDLFLHADTDGTLRRLYDYPGLNAGGTVQVTGAKRYVPITSDNSSLIIQNVRALKLMILAIEFEENNKLAEGKAYRQEAIELLQKEVKKHQLDPRNSLKRKANYQADLVECAPDSLGRTRAKLALELPGFLLKGKAEITYLINRALEALVRRENFLRIAQKWDIHDAATEIPINLPVNDRDTLLTAACPGSLAADDYDIIKRMCQFMIHAEKPIVDVAPTSANAGVNTAQVSATLESEVYGLLEARLAERLEFLRRTTYETVLTNAGSTTAGYTVARLALDLPNGLKLSNPELMRLVNSAEHRLMERGKWKGTITECVATVESGMVFMPRAVEGILAASLDGSPARIRSRYFESHENAPGEFCCDEACARLLLDEGEDYNAVSNSTRRRYKVLAGGCSEGSTLRAIVKLRWLIKTADDILVIQNYEALRLMVLSILAQTDANVANAFQAQAVDVLQRELQEHLAGIMPHIQIQVRGTPRIRMLR